ncbi:MAG: hypothetical protein JXQ30_00830 [Spirochaetes bacterium]|nr:hypothetical protein [Spirochaetota bacterium]
MKLMSPAVLVILSVGLGVTACNTGGEIGAVDGTVTVTLSNAGAVDDDTLSVYVYAEGETDVNNPAKLLATNFAVITDGTASVVLREDDGDWMPTVTNWTGTGGTTYDIYIYTDSDGDGELETGTVYITDPFPGTVTIDGDQTVATDFAEMILYE